jgi:hypothetical protein
MFFSVERVVMKSKNEGQLNTTRGICLMLVSFIATKVQEKYFLPPSHTGAYSCGATPCNSEGEARMFLMIYMSKRIDGNLRSVASPESLVLVKLVVSQFDEKMQKFGCVFQDLVTQQYYFAAGMEEANYASLLNKMPLLRRRSIRK